jgi:hypothetical protein
LPPSKVSAGTSAERTLPAFFALPPSLIVEKILLVAVLLDLALGGNGYLVKIGSFRVREILFAFCIPWALLRLTIVRPVRLDPKVWALFGLFVAVTAFGAALGYFNGSRSGVITAELKPLSYFPMLFFFLVSIQSRADLTLVARILVVCGILLSFLYLLLLLCAKIGLVGYSSIFNFLHVSDEFIFRHTFDNQAPFVGFFYKGAFYICIAALFLIFDPFRITKILAAVTVVAVAMTLTRGLCFSLAGCILAGAVLNRNWRRAPLLAGLAILLLSVYLFAQRAEQNLVFVEVPPNTAQANRPVLPKRLPADQSVFQLRQTDADRTSDIRFIVSKIDASMLATGRGLGAPIRDRDRIELTYFEILYKQGIPGLLVWALLFAYTVQLYRAVPAQTRTFGLAFFMSSLFVFISTAATTFLTGSIGMGVVFISTAGLSVLAREERRPMPRSDWYGYG